MDSETAADLEWLPWILSEIARDKTEQTSVRLEAIRIFGLLNHWWQPIEGDFIVSEELPLRILARIQHILAKSGSQGTEALMEDSTSS
jgi:hypothetical protein